MTKLEKAIMRGGQYAIGFRYDIGVYYVSDNAFQCLRASLNGRDPTTSELLLIIEDEDKTSD